jgi:hypothetical protein
MMDIANTPPANWFFIVIKTARIRLMMNSGW